MAKKAKVISYTRDREANKGAPYFTRFAGFIKGIAEAKTFGCDTIVIAEPWVIGDTYEEIIQSLSHLAGTGVGLQIVTARNVPWKN